jgi:hypothetical protein
MNIFFKNNSFFLKIILRMSILISTFGANFKYFIYKLNFYYHEQSRID